MHENFKNIQIGNSIPSCIEILNSSGLIAFPTDTLYSLTAKATDVTAIKKVFQLKNRSYSNPIPILFSDIKQILSYAEITNDVFYKIVKKYMPGPITIIVKNKGKIQPVAEGVSSTLAVRIPNYSPIRKLITQLKSPITGTSINISGSISLNTHNEIISEFKDKINYIYLRNTPPPPNVPSTIIDISSQTPKIVREGIIKLEELSKEINIR